ncbi:hypothetical protein D8B26_006353 [Coccidioides posadasii str. Silveira]|uniref:Ser/Thr protein phosphatase superfamily protein n=3 Tax=Coccidioides posadasii TaxID=199306 RepID=E9CSW8_COCPS|nr:hypothetical protein CPC735_028990 [Coccidioides posadasii C735 delta SOWgp]EER27563.1 hypothetical protein CPC735_028990 [Coccidioides posadasii C735 delta SOWgp]EFW22778.1 Ser/Thr protein phosphatase superfamily protein [Coccidioides posadasii str. Silveira]KMM67424.1 ser/Thr protein phosphatase superfamily [Coccidioides posadasii RMSCC 3488]QVM11710.1 hypothetical protein D8B26_006353 [Coccidioides posadasii str. Silveira]|eukprot:XP_003069708.1 hypothetical protein CPC735_028990 [Coccidioides posadasii C735 delta SOWgp]
MEVQILSDLHLETPAAYDIFTVNPKAPYLALLGDTGNVRDDGFFTFIRGQLQNFQLVFLLLGNHEPFYSSWMETKAKLERFQNEMERALNNKEVQGKLIFLDRARYDISPTVTVLGCTLFSHITPEQKEDVSFGMNDFYYISGWSVEAHQAAHLEDLAWLNKEVESISRQDPERKVVIFTHYCPTTDEKVIDPTHTNSHISSGFMTDLSKEACWGDTCVKLWAFGHTHFNCDFLDHETAKRVVCNQRGYYFAQSKGFDGDKVVKI